MAGLSNLFLRHHGSLALAGFLGGSAFGLYYTLQHGRAPFGLWESGQPAEQEQSMRAVTLRLR